MRRPATPLLVAGAVAAILLAAGSTVGLAAATGAFGGRGPNGAGARCAAPALPGTVVGVTLVDRSGMMGGQPGSGRMMGGGWRNMPVARVFASPGVVRAGTVSLRVVNRGAQTHELVVLPLPAGQAVGTRTVGADGQVDEAASLGEASRNCGAGAGDGIAPGALSWLTLTLPPGRYELVCNLPGHYAAGMYTELDLR